MLFSNELCNISLSKYNTSIDTLRRTNKIDRNFKMSLQLKIPQAFTSIFAAKVLSILKTALEEEIVQSFGLIVHRTQNPSSYK